MHTSDFLILRQLRRCSRQSITSISKETGIPITTVFTRLKKTRHLVTKFTSLVNFAKLGYSIKVLILLHTMDSEIQDYNINSLHKLDSGRQLIEAVFKDMKAYYEFCDLIRKKGIAFETFHIIEELKREDFLTKEDHFELCK
ncbi:MAG: Lrp/AsnC family transcriptional regulator [Candidatus Woesearchaeota archaeon]